MPNQEKIEAKKAEIEAKAAELLALDLEVHEIRENLVSHPNKFGLMTALDAKRKHLKKTREKFLKASPEQREAESIKFREALRDFSISYREFNEAVSTELKVAKKDQIDLLELKHAELMKLRIELDNIK